MFPILPARTASFTSPATSRRPPSGIGITRRTPGMGMESGAGDLRVESDGVFFFCCIKPSVSIRYTEETLMTTALPALETQRSEIQRKIGQLGDMRSGSITTTGGRCGNPGCHCRKDGDPGHGPFYRLTRKIEGKTVTETFATPVALRKAQQEVAEFH